MPRLIDPDPDDLPTLTILVEATRAGLTADQVRHRVRAGHWNQVARGAYLPDGDRGYAGLDEFARQRIEHVQRCVAAALRNPGSVITDASAALVHGMAVRRVPQNVQLVVPGGSRSGSRSGIDFRVRHFEELEVEHHRVSVATPGRAWLDVTRFGALADSLVCGDAGVREGILSFHDLDVDLRRWRGQWGCRRLERAIALVDGARESVLESASFAYFADHRVPLPECQVEIRSRAGRFLARVDFFWPGRRIVGEADGKLKYDARDSLYAEKRREDALRAEGLRVVRWGMSDLQGRALAGRLRKLVA